MDGEPEKSGKNRVVVIGLDGGTFSLLDPLMEEGHMPNLKKLIESGVRGDLQTVIPPITPAAWSTFMTGKNPGKHGVLEFLVKDGEGGESPVNSNIRCGRTIWRLVSENGEKAVVLSVPTTYPPEHINGFMISCFMTPKGKSDYGYPPELLEEVEAKFGPYRLSTEEVYARGKVGDVLDDSDEDVRYKFEVARYLLDRVDWKLFVLHIFGTDRLQHELWHLIDPKHPLHKPKESRLYADRFYQFYEKLDTQLGLFVEKLRPTDTLFIMSDHGFGPVYRFMNFNVWLMERGYLKLRRGPWAFIKRILFRLGVTPKNAYRLLMWLGKAKIRQTIGVTNRKGFFDIAGRIVLSMRDVDWSRTKAYSKGYYGQIFINLKGREPFGTVEPEDYESVREKIVRDLEAITDPETGKKIIGPIYKPNDLYVGPFIKNAPDISFIPKDMTYKAIGTTDFTSNRFLEPVYANSGDHRLNGIFIARGPGIKEGGTLDGARIAQVAPTILHMLGMPVPDDMDGQVLGDIYKPEFLRDHPVEFYPAPPDDPPGPSGYTEEEKENIRKKLEDLGYL